MSKNLTIALSGIPYGPGSSDLYWDDANNNLTVAGSVFSNDIINVKAYGATGDGSTDDATAIQAAIDAANTAGGGNIYFPTGTYNFGSGLTMKPEVRLVGANRQNTILQYTPSSGDAITGGADLLRVGFENIKFNSNNSSSGWAIFFDEGTTASFRMINCKIGNFLKGLRIDDGMQCVIDDVYINGQGKAVTGGIGVQLGESSSQSGTTWSVNSLFVTICETGMVVYAGQCGFDNIIVENATTAVKVYAANIWSNIWSAANTTFWNITDNGQFIQGFREGGATTDYVFSGNSTEIRTTIIPRTADLNASNNKANHIFFPIKTYSNGKVLIHDDASTDTSSTMPLNANFTGALNIWGTTEEELKISVPRQTAPATGKNLYVQAGGAQSTSTDQDGGILYLMAGTATGDGDGEVRIMCAGEGSTGTSDSVPSTKWKFKGDGSLEPASDAGIGGAYSLCIGANVPATGYKLDVQGDLSLGETGGVDNSFIDQKQNGSLDIINSGAAGNTGKVRINKWNTLAGGTTLYRDFIVYDGKTNEILTVDGSEGNVGIGTTSPEGLLHIKHATNSTDLSANHIFGLSTGNITISASPIAKAWVTWNGSGDAIFSAYNVSSVTSSGGTGLYQVNFATAMSDANINVQGTVLASSKGNVSVNEVDTTDITLYTRVADSGAALTDYGRVGIIVYGN